MSLKENQFLLQIYEMQASQEKRALFFSIANPPAKWRRLTDIRTQTHTPRHAHKGALLMAAPKISQLFFSFEIPMHVVGVYLPHFPAEVFPAFYGHARQYLSAYRTFLWCFKRFQISVVSTSQKCASRSILLHSDIRSTPISRTVMCHGRKIG